MGVVAAGCFALAPVASPRTRLVLALQRPGAGGRSSRRWRPTAERDGGGGVASAAVEAMLAAFAGPEDRAGAVGRRRGDVEQGSRR